MSQSKKNNILVGDFGNTETKIFFRNNKIEKKIALKSNEMIYSKIKSKVLFLDHVLYILIKPFLL